MDKVVIRQKLNGNNLIIRYPKKSDANSMLQYINTLSDEKTFILFQGEHLTLKEEVEYLDNHLGKIRKNELVQLLVFIDEKLVGISEIKMKDKAHKHIGEFGISIAKEFRGKGIGKLLMDTILKEAKKNIPRLRIISLGVYANNPIAFCMYEKFGFIKYGKLPKGIIYKSEHIDEILMYKNI